MQKIIPCHDFISSITFLPTSSKFCRMLRSVGGGVWCQTPHQICAHLTEQWITVGISFHLPLYSLCVSPGSITHKDHSHILYHASFTWRWQWRLLDAKYGPIFEFRASQLYNLSISDEFESCHVFDGWYWMKEGTKKYFQMLNTYWTTPSPLSKIVCFRSQYDFR